MRACFAALAKRFRTIAGERRHLSAAIAYAVAVDMVAIATELGDAGRCVCPNFLLPALQRDVRLDLDAAYRAGQFSRAGTGQGTSHLVRDDVRRDEVYWPDQAQANAVQLQLWAKTAALMQAINRTLFLGLHAFEGHYASYAAGGFYQRHVDAFADDDARMVSLVLYLNHDWQPSDGGRLRMYDQAKHVDVAPLGGTLVCFLSREVEHEVMPTTAARFSFVGWYKTAAASGPKRTSRARG